MNVSIIIPVYNVAPYVEECIRSVMNQTMTEEVECIIVDDCGQDDSMEIVEKVLAKEGYTECEDGSLISTRSPLIFRILHHDHNKGLSAARNTGIDAAKGEYLYFLDSDDYLFSDSAIESFDEYLNRKPRVDVVLGLTRSNDENITKWTHSKIVLGLPKYIYDRETCRHLIQSNQLSMMMQNIMVRTTLIKKCGLYCVEGIIHEDALWSMMMGKHICSFALNKKDTYFYRKRNGSIMSNMNGEKSVASLYTIVSHILSNIDLSNGFKDELNFAISMSIIARQRSSQYDIHYHDYRKDFLFDYMCCVKQHNLLKESFLFKVLSSLYRIERKIDRYFTLN